MTRLIRTGHRVTAAGPRTPVTPQDHHAEGEHTRRPCLDPSPPRCRHGAIPAATGGKRDGNRIREQSRCAVPGGLPRVIASGGVARAAGREAVGMNDSEGIRALRRELGRALKEARGAAGYSQAQLARKTGYARSTVSTVESGSQNVPRIFWERSDAALGAGAALIARYDRLAQGRVARVPHAAAGTRGGGGGGGRPGPEGGGAGGG